METDDFGLELEQALEAISHTEQAAYAQSVREFERLRLSLLIWVETWRLDDLRYNEYLRRLNDARDLYDIEAMWAEARQFIPPPEEPRQQFKQHFS